MEKQTIKSIAITTDPMIRVRITLFPCSSSFLLRESFLFFLPIALKFNCYSMQNTINLHDEQNIIQVMSRNYNLPPNSIR